MGSRDAAIGRRAFLSPTPSFNEGAGQWRRPVCSHDDAVIGLHASLSLAARRHFWVKVDTIVKAPEEENFEPWIVLPWCTAEGLYILQVTTQTWPNAIGPLYCYTNSGGSTVNLRCGVMFHGPLKQACSSLPGLRHWPSHRCKSTPHHCLETVVFQNGHAFSVFTEKLGTMINACVLGCVCVCVSRLAQDNISLLATWNPLLSALVFPRAWRDQLWREIRRAFSSKPHCPIIKRNAVHLINIKYLSTVQCMLYALYAAFVHQCFLFVFSQRVDAPGALSHKSLLGRFCPNDTNWKAAQSHKNATFVYAVGTAVGDDSWNCHLQCNTIGDKGPKRTVPKPKFASTEHCLKNACTERREIWEWTRFGKYVCALLAFLALFCSQFYRLSAAKHRLLIWCRHGTLFLCVSRFKYKLLFCHVRFVLETDTYIVFVVVKIYILYIYTTNSRSFCVQTIFEMKLLFKLHSTRHSCPCNRVVHGSQRAPHRCCSNIFIVAKEHIDGRWSFVCPKPSHGNNNKKKENA